MIPFEGTAEQKRIADGIVKILGTAVVKYTLVPYGRETLIVVSPDFQGRSYDDRQQQIRAILMTDLQIDPAERFAAIECWTPQEDQGDAKIT